MKKLTVGSLFAGIGGLELGLEWTGGFETVWQVEIDEYAQKVLKKHWPDCGRWDDVRTFPPPPAEDWSCDLICGGFPCQPFSTASRGRRIAADLWPEMLRVVEAIKPQIVVAENVSKQACKIAKDNLESCGYCASLAPAGAHEIGADHIRNRWWVLAHANHKIELPVSINAEMAELQAVRHGVWGWARFAERCRVSDGVPARVDRLRCLGNAVVPQVAQWIGQRILAAEQANDT